jgi:hypothetical protein
VSYADSGSLTLESSSYVANSRWGNFPNPTPVSLTYSYLTVTTATFDETGLPNGTSGTLSPLSSFMPSGWEAAIDAAFAAWEAVAGVTFTKVTDSGLNYNLTLNDGDADIRIAGHNLGGAGGTLAHAVTASSNAAPTIIRTAWIDFDTQDTWFVNSLDNNANTFDIFQVAAHEIGHAIGLSHVGPPPTALMNPIYTEAFSGPQADDIAGARFLYGPSAIPEAKRIPLLASLLMAGLVAARRRK